MTSSRRSSLLAFAALVVLTMSLAASSLHAHPLGSTTTESECGACHWARVVGAASPAPEIQFEPVLVETSLVPAPPGASRCLLSGETSSSRAPPRV